jgi:hypothetical protein
VIETHHVSKLYSRGVKSCRATARSRSGGRNLADLSPRACGNLVCRRDRPGSLVFLSNANASAVLLAGMGVGALGGFIAARGAREIAD